jgi:hypothetical protein
MRILIRAPNGIFRKNSDAKNHRGVVWHITCHFRCYNRLHNPKRRDKKIKKATRPKKGNSMYTKKGKVYIHT